jgi:guanylate kinase
MMVIMLAGQARVGKTTLAKWLSEYLYHKGYYPVILPFAGMLKEEVAAMGLTKENNPIEYREMCQKIGSSKRAEDPDYWVNKFRERAAKIKDEDIIRLEDSPKTWAEKVVLVDDCRYLNEIALGNELNALKIFISKGKRELEDAQADWRQHESEEMANNFEDGNKDIQSMFHYRIVNEDTEADYKKKVSALFDEWIELAGDLYTNLCDCEVCAAHRLDRDIDLNVMIDQVIELLEKQLEKDSEETTEDSDS